MTVAGAPPATPFRVALTFDAEHPDRRHRPGVTEEILDVLRERRVASTWFLEGRWVEAVPDVARRVARDGHLIGSHTFYHARLPLLTDDGLRTDIAAAEAVIRAETGADPRPWFRCPFMAGADDPRILATIAEMGYRQIGADVVLDDREPERSGPILVADAIPATLAHGDGAVILLHAWPPGTLDGLPAMIDGLRARGADFVRIDALDRYAG